ncbi:MAG: hypothetical protein R2695_04385 [Acidimicrobiales bacterium]
MPVDDDPERQSCTSFAFVALSLFGALFTRLWFLQGIESETLRAGRGRPTSCARCSRRPRGSHPRSQRSCARRQQGDRRGHGRPGSVGGSHERRARRLVPPAGRHHQPLGTAHQGRVDRAGLESDQHGHFDVVPIAADVDRASWCILGERADEYPGVAVEQRTVSYPYGNLAAHLLGYVGPVTLEEMQAANARIDPDTARASRASSATRSGRAAWRVFESDLRGVPGVRYLEVDNHGNVIRERRELARDPVPGSDVVLTVDIDLQAVTEKELAEGSAAGVGWRLPPAR